MKYEIWLSRDDGTRLALLDNVSQFEYAISLHQVGACVVHLPGTFDKTLLAADRRIEIWRGAGQCGAGVGAGVPDPAHRGQHRCGRGCAR